MQLTQGHFALQLCEIGELRRHVGRGVDRVFRLFSFFFFLFKVDRLQIILVAKNIYIYVSQLFISRMPKMRAIPQLVSAPLNPMDV